MSFKVNLHHTTSGDLGFMAQAYIRDNTKWLNHVAVKDNDELWQARWNELWSLSLSLQAFKDGLYYSIGAKDKFPVNPHRYKR